MLSGRELSFFDTLLIAVSGMTVVMLELILIAVMIVVMSKLIRAFGDPERFCKAAVPTPVSDGGEEQDEIFAVIMSAVSEELQIPLERLEFRSIKEIS